MTSAPAISLDEAREAKTHVLENQPLLSRYVQSIGIARDDGNYCVRVSLGEDPPGPVFANFPTSVTTQSGNEVRIVYRTIGRIRAAAYA